MKIYLENYNALIRTTMDTGNYKEESKAISFFLNKKDRNRFESLIKSKKGRKKLLLTLDHNFIDKIDPRYITQLRGNKSEIIDTVKDKFKSKKCFTISSHINYDQLELEIIEALEMVIGYGMGTIIYSVDESAIFYESEDQNGSYLISKESI